MDAYLDSATTWVVTRGLILFNTLSNVLELVWGFTTRTVRGIQDAHKDEVWVFRERNEMPWVTRGEVAFPNAYAIYFPESNHFYILRGGTAQRLDGKPFDTVVLASLYNVDRTLEYDLSSFFHSFRWFSSAGTPGPTLHELVTLWFCSEGHMFNNEQMNGFTLEVMLNDGTTVRQQFNSTRAYSPFESWEEFKEEEEGLVVEQEVSDSDSEGLPNILPETGPMSEVD